MASNGFDVEKYRNPFESNTEWRMRKVFLEEHHDKLDEDRLVCLANCYVNVQMYGCEYPTQTMIQLRELIEQLPDN